MQDSCKTHCLSHWLSSSRTHLFIGASCPCPATAADPGNVDQPIQQLAGPRLVVLPIAFPVDEQEVDVDAVLVDVRLLVAAAAAVTTEETGRTMLGLYRILCLEANIPLKACPKRHK